ncbi:MAG: ABC transporter substrate-binding protein [Oscillospiraceae bacterium]|nr:ABC transporter substrate-binding protein [Oscillospiraceae bacterium]
MKKKLIALLSVTVLLSSCGDVTNEDINGIPEIEETVLKTEIIIGTSGMTGVFSPFFTKKGTGDYDVMSVVNAPLVTLDRRGEIVRNASVGEWRVFDGEEYFYEGISDVSVNITDNYTTILNFRLRDDVFFSDGENLSADDLIFTLYTLCDADYKGSYGLSLIPVEGMDYYRTDSDEETYNKYAEIAAAFFDINAGLDEASGDFDEEQYLLYNECYEEAWLSHVRAIIDYCVDNYADFSHVIGEGDIYTDEWMQVALAMMVWRIADFEIILTATEESDAVYGPLKSVLGREWNLTNRFPTVWDFYREFYELYDGDLGSYIDSEKIGIPLLDEPLKEVERLFIGKSAALDPDNNGARNISGIRRVGDYEVEITLTGHIPSAVYSFVFPVAPLHYYGDITLYDYARDNFGLERGNLSSIRARSAKPLGAGAYRFIEYNDGIAALAANEHYFKGQVQTHQITFKETGINDLIYGTASGALDIAVVGATRDTLDEINAYESSGILGQATDYGVLGYIGINAERVNVDGEPESEESIALRKGFATVFAAYREISVTDYYGYAARIAEYPISGVSWAAPRVGDSGYKTAFGTYADGSDIFIETMSEARRLEAAKNAALSFFKDAGAQLNSAGTAVLEFPEDLKTEYEIFIDGNGAGRHPSSLLLNMAVGTLRTTGINISVRDVTQGELYAAIMNGEADMWCAVFEAQILPQTGKLFSSYGEDNFFGFSDEMTDQRIALAESSLSIEFHRNALDAVIESAVCVPVYQRQQYFLFGASLDPDTIEDGLTTHYDMADILWQIKIKV